MSRDRIWFLTRRLSKELGEDESLGRIQDIVHNCARSREAKKFGECEVELRSYGIGFCGIKARMIVNGRRGRVDCRRLAEGTRGYLSLDDDIFIFVVFLCG